jgi:hypothetical protein
MKCDICGSTPGYGTFPNLVLCDACAPMWGRPVVDRTNVPIKQEVLSKDDQMKRIDSDRPEWQIFVYGGKKR